MEGINFYKKPRLKDPYLIAAWPGMGEVAFSTVRYLVETLKAQQVAEINSQDYFYLTSSVIREGLVDLPELPFNKFYSFRNRSGKNDILFFLSNAQPDLSKAKIYTEKILHVAKTFKVNKVINLAAMPQPIDHTQKPAVWCAPTSAGISGQLKEYGLNFLKEGQISGMNGLFLGLAKKEGMEGFCFLAEIPLYTIQIDNPKASVALIEVLNKIMGLNVDLSGLKERTGVMEEEISRLLEYLKVGPVQGPIGEEEIEKIKKSLSQLTKLPVSIKEKIEKLFGEAKRDIAKAPELKGELDKWNIYQDYEDRFLDLFKRKKEKGN